MLTALILSVLPLLVVAQGSVIVFTQDIPHEIVQEFRDMPATFGAQLPEEGLHGFLVTGEPRNGCQPIKPKPANQTNFTGKWIVLLARYNCSFEMKVRHAQAAGFDCAIVHNVDSSELETMSAKNADDITIPSVFVSDVAGIALANEFIYTQGFYIMVNGDLPFNINTHLLLPFAIVVALCLITMIIFIIIKCIKDRRRAARHRLPHRSLRRIPTCRFSKGDPYDTCAICLDDYTHGDLLRVLPCAHAYHSACIDPWLTQNRRVCPVCKRRVLAIGERRQRRTASHSDSDSSQEPLISSSSTIQGGGTFMEQRENPFVRAARFMRMMRRSTPQPDDEQPREVENADAESPPSIPATQEQSVSDEESESNRFANQPSDDRAPLLSGSQTTRPSNLRRDNRRRSQSTRARRSRHTSEPIPQTTTRSPTTLSINTERGEIGVAAIPKTSNPNRNVNL